MLKKGGILGDRSSNAPVHKTTCFGFCYTSLQIYFYYSLPMIIMLNHYAFLHLPLFTARMCVCV